MAFDRVTECAPISSVQCKAALRRAQRSAARALRLGLWLAICASAVLRIGVANAQDASMLDERVTQQSVADTICRPGYADSVSPPLDKLMQYKSRLLAEQGISSTAGIGYALDRHVPIVLGGSPDSPANLGLLPWAGHTGERRKELLTAKLKRCVCA
ncbi:MAG TPA: hypothetical protein VEI25_02515, partial [Paraburkholderia sp.]|nr:hypothetical protein [Paraburkholderia sp.]